MYYSGIDQHKRDCMITTYDGDGQRVKQQRVPNSREQLRRYAASANSALGSEPRRIILRGSALIARVSAPEPQEAHPTDRCASPKPSANPTPASATADTRSNCRST